MSTRAWILGLALILAPLPVAAEAPGSSVRPSPRPAVYGVAEVISASSAPSRSMRPARRPGIRIASVAQPAPVATPRDPLAALLQSLTASAPAPAALGATALAVARSPRPEPRPRNFTRLAAAAVAAPRATSRRGSVCGVAEIKGEALAPVPGPGACGIDAPVRVTSVSGVALRQSPTIDCPTAIALNDWVRRGVIPAVGRTGGGVAQINVIAHYSCRTRNNRKGARLSEHSFGHAVDVSGVTLKDGTRLTVLEHWGGGRFGKIIKAMHTTACGPFGTVLGPNSDRYHRDHLHVDTARYRSGSYCR